MRVTDTSRVWGYKLHIGFWSWEVLVVAMPSISRVHAHRFVIHARNMDLGIKISCPVGVHKRPPIMVLPPIMCARVCALFQREKMLANYPGICRSNCVICCKRNCSHTLCFKNSQSPISGSG